MISNSEDYYYYTEGSKAFDEGIHFVDCPYEKGSQCKNLWQEGWFDRKKEQDDE